ncbi:hypothetical protein I5M27_09160 [Adhaeribacter sp. BT258]|uniref:MORN repeat variant n=1 Tax=Adhaeribacter terrigena TaxID=2793070 RepID=A0ABS1C168_9BACT|nr:hypothetical protein [Adhaeribacter terrigena]MBK0403152.1 hypothetical protein [Adhaeribacter terrigena]
MNKVLFGLLLFLLYGCISEKGTFKRSITIEEKNYLAKNDSLVKSFQGPSNSKQLYQTGNLIIRNSKDGYKIIKFGEWKEIKRLDNSIQTIVFYDESETVLKEIIYGPDGNPLVESTLKKEVSNQNNFLYYNTNVYHLYSDKLQSKGMNILAKNKKFIKDGTWEYFTRDGEFEKKVEFKSGKIIN